MDPELTALTSTAATTVVRLLATAAWEQAKNAVGGLWRRVHPDRAETVQAELDETRTELLVARQVGDEQVEQALVSEWQGRLRRLVVADPRSGMICVGWWRSCGRRWLPPISSRGA